MKEIKLNGTLIRWYSEMESIVIDMVYTDPNHRGNGQTRRYLKAALNFLKRKHNLPIEIFAYAQDDETDQDRLVEFYESLGFEKDADQCGEGCFMTL